MSMTLRCLCMSLLVSLGLLGKAQDSSALSSFDEFMFYGVDYAQAKVARAMEHPASFLEAFERINLLLKAEPKKYKVGRRTHKKVKGTSLSAVNKRNRAINIDSLMLDGTDYNFLSHEQIEEELNALPLTETDGVGLVIIAELLDKSREEGLYHVVFFDVATRKLITKWKVSGKAGGFGLRNHWANSLVKVLRST